MDNDSLHGGALPSGFIIRRASNDVHSRWKLSHDEVVDAMGRGDHPVGGDDATSAELRSFGVQDKPPDKGHLPTIVLNSGGNAAHNSRANVQSRSQKRLFLLRNGQILYRLVQPGKRLPK